MVKWNNFWRISSAQWERAPLLNTRGSHSTTGWQSVAFAALHKVSWCLGPTMQKNAVTNLEYGTRSQSHDALTRWNSRDSFIDSGYNVSKQHWPPHRSGGLQINLNPTTMFNALLNLSTNDVKWNANSRARGQSMTEGIVSPLTGAHIQFDSTAPPILWHFRFCSGSLIKCRAERRESKTQCIAISATRAMLRRNGDSKDCASFISTGRSFSRNSVGIYWKASHTLQCVLSFEEKVLHKPPAWGSSQVGPKTFPLP